MPKKTPGSGAEPQLLVTTGTSGDESGDFGRSGVAYREVAFVQFTLNQDMRDEKPNLTAKQFKKRLATIEQRLDKLISAKRKFTDPDNARFARRLRKQREHLFTFLTQDGVDPTNNRAERDLRPAVVVRKTGGCNKTKKGADTHAVNTSVIATAKKNGQNLVLYIADVLRTPPGTPLPLPITTARASP